MPDHSSKVVLGREYALNTYHEVFLMSDPTLCFIAMARIFSLTPYYDTQAIAIARVWSGNAYVPETRWMCQLEAEFKPGLPSKINMYDIRRREVYVSWLNYQANKMGESDLPQVKNFDDDYEQETNNNTDINDDIVETIPSLKDESLLTTEGFYVFLI
ncbi:hypothetical protein G6F68_016399 [Rhizopus microsporus]|nr:hypothetical protein G6F68_016399 [Rhizopus microsporus]